MRTYLTAGILLGLLAGCSSDQAPVADLAKAASNTQPASAFAFRSPALSFASLPDRGELLVYEKGRKTKHKGAYTAYPVAISEAHALRAMQSGEMIVNAPNGEPIRLTYERHEENKDGNWTWIGRNADGAEAILTFGEKAVFGVIPQGATDTLRLTMSAGQSWLVQTDRSKLAGLDGSMRREGGDQLVPPKLAGTGSTSLVAKRAQPVAAGASAAAASVVDVLLGYTNGFASQLGGSSQANTRLVNMVAITNQAYVNSGVSMRVRLVKTLQVNYADNTDNGDALEKLTGYKAGTDGGPITPDPAFNALRAAREETGADLVSLVRAFRTPENNGCGIAWLIGGDESGIVQADAPFGYSVVSDGTDLDEGDDNTYFCREETLAHEMGHNMGQAHNQEDSDSTGVHPYSYGYREASSTGFYTVMAYPQADGDQFSIRHFANPSVKYSGRATGVANQSDNVRSLNQSMPIIATFRATVVPVSSEWNVAGVGDINADGRADVFWHNPGIQRTDYWTMNGPSVVDRGGLRYIQAKYQVAGTGDFNGDGRLDILWQDDAQSELWVWLANSSGSFTTQYVRSYPKGWKVAGVSDSNADGRADIFWHNSSLGRLQVWRMNGSAFSYGPVSSIGSYTVAAIGDFNADKRADIIWVNTAKTQVWQWQAQTNGSYRSIYIRSYPAGWTIVGADDVNGDRRADIFWHSSTKQSLQYWLMNGAVLSAYGPAKAVQSKYRVAGVKDFNGDGRADVLWYDTSKTQLWMWQAASNGTFNALQMRAYPAPN
ncbi:FG-GAP-like repeat-containing protein [Luteimonas notoginsengisoli]|uniref:FG-GAP-like repeat-containing protein n=1 Tax=Luteimonas notoginsengisoli TaxID=1578200 RepID=A0ABV7UPN7_9GAMM